MVQVERRSKALQDLSVIRETIQQSTGSTYFMDFFQTAGTLLLLFGFSTIIASGATYALAQGLIPVARPAFAIVLVWSAVFAVTGVAKWIHIAQRARALEMSILQYNRRFFTAPFIHALMPIGLGAIAFVLYFVQNGHAECVPAAITLYAGAVYASFGTLFHVRVLVYAGYELSVLGAIGLLLLTPYVLAYTALIGGLLAVHGVFFSLWLKRTRKQESACRSGQDSTDEC